MAEKVKSILKNLSFALIPSLILLLIIEMSLRIFFGYPTKIFSFISKKGEGLYPANRTMKVTLGPVPYTVETNSLGFRGREIPIEKPKNTVRIAALGDSVTDGFYVDNEATYPYLLEKILKDDNHSVEVINAARGRASIDKEYAILKEWVLPLKPDIILLTFVTNDIQDIQGVSKNDLISKRLRHRARIVEWLITETAIGEAALDLHMRSKYKQYRLHERNDSQIRYDANRYLIKGGGNFLANVKIFNKRYSKTDGLVLNEPFAKKVIGLIDNYLYALKDMNSFCRDKNMRLIFVYIPGYPQIYDPNTTMRMRDIFKNACKDMSVPFIDLTSVYRNKGKHEVLHLAPVDFHHNPKGNKVMAESIAEFLVEKMLLN